jgi:hypothetical protein
MGISKGFAKVKLRMGYCKTALSFSVRMQRFQKQIKDVDSFMVTLDEFSEQAAEALHIMF